MPRVEPLGDAALLVTFAREISADHAERVRQLGARLHAAPPRGVTDIVPGYATLAVYFDPAVADFRPLADVVREMLAEASGRGVGALGRDVTIPVVYDGPDLAEVAERTGLNPAGVAARHAAVTYRVYMIGFVPGFAYLGDLDPVLVLPRRATPRQKVPAGSVAIAGAQTAVYPLQTPGGWHLIGRTAAVMFDPERDPPALLRAGDRVRFVAEGE